MNFTIEVHNNEYISNHIKQHKFWEGITTEIILEIIRENKSAMFIDIGANIGWFSLVCASYGVKSIAFEPIKTNTKLFKKSIEMNGYDKMITLHEIALGDEDKFIDLNVTTENMGLCSKRPLSNVSYIERCKMKRLDDLVSPDLSFIIKIDVEEMELNVLQGMSRLLKSGLAKYLIIEISLYDEKVFEILEKNGYVYCIDLGFDKKDHVFSTRTNYLHTQKYFTTLGYIRDSMRENLTNPLDTGLSHQRSILFSLENFSD